MNVYQLETFSEIPAYQGFVWKRNRMPNYFGFKYGRDGSRDTYHLKQSWEPAEVIGDVSPWNDFPMVQQELAFSERAVSALRDLLEPNGEILPIQSEVGQYYAYNCTTLSDALDIEKSSIRLKEKAFDDVDDWEELNRIGSLNILGIDRYLFHSSKLNKMSIFRVKQIPNQYFVTDAFLKRVKGYGLNGFLPIKISPLPEGVEYWEYAREGIRACENKAKAMRNKNRKKQSMEPPLKPLEFVWGNEISSEKRSERPAAAEAALSSPVESSVSSDYMQMIESVALRASELLGVDPKDDLPADIVEAVDRCVHDLQNGKGPEFAADLEQDLSLAALWGSQIIRALGWEWAQVTFPDQGDRVSVGVFSPDRSMAIHPFHFVFDCLENRAEVKITLSFNLLRKPTDMPSFPAGGYEDVMDHVQFIVPRDE